MGKKKAMLSSKAKHQIWVANEKPDPTYDLAECEVTELPEDVFSSCKVLQKEALILHTNSLSSLTDNGNKLQNLSNLLVLDLHTNSLSKLHPDIRYLVNLQVLNLSHNALPSLPPEIKELKKLQTFNLSDNKLTKLPSEIGKLCSLRTLNVSSNNVHKLPVTLCHATALESLTLDVESMKYPDKATCQGGIEAIMRALCKDGGIEYMAPSKAVLPLLQGGTGGSATGGSAAINPAIAHLHPDNIQAALFTVLPLAALMTDPALSNYEETRLRKQKENLLIEQENMQDTQHLSDLLRDQQEKKVHQVASLVQDNKDCEENISQLHQRKDADRQRLYNLILEEDTKATELIDDIIKRNSESKEREDLLQEIEDDRERELAHITVKNEEIALLRKEEMMRAMRQTLEEMAGFDIVLNKYMRSKEETIKHAQQQFREEDEQIAMKLTDRGHEQQNAVENILSEDEWQRRALEALMKQKDDRHSQLTYDISSLEKQLARLSIVEMSNKMATNQAKKDMLREQREHLTRLLLQLMDQRDLRAKEIARRMVEMEAAREDDMADYWLAQLQRLIDRKPQAQIDRESQLEIAVIDILNMSGAEDYISRFAQHKVSIETMKKLSDEDLRRIGVHEVGIRKSILKNTQVYLEKIGEMPDPEEKKLSEAANKVPGAPADSMSGAQSTLPSAPSQILTHVSTECVICLDKQTSIVFLPCGHVCTCLDCSQPLFHCPMCRAKINQKIILES